MTATAGPLLVCDDNLIPEVVAWPHDHVTDLLPHWPWHPTTDRQRQRP